MINLCYLKLKYNSLQQQKQANKEYTDTMFIIYFTLHVQMPYRISRL